MGSIHFHFLALALLMSDCKQHMRSCYLSAFSASLKLDLRHTQCLLAGVCAVFTAQTTTDQILLPTVRRKGLQRTDEREKEW